MTTNKMTKDLTPFLTPFLTGRLSVKASSEYFEATAAYWEHVYDDMPSRHGMCIVPEHKLSFDTGLRQMVVVDACRLGSIYEWPGSQRFAPFITNRMIQQAPQKVLTLIEHGALEYDTAAWQSDNSEESFQVELLRRITEGESWDQMREAVLLAETTPFSDGYRPILLSGLRQFIDTYKFVDDEQVITAVCAALRKYILNMRPEHAVYIAGLLVPAETKSLSNLAELTIVKSFCQYLQLFPVRNRTQFTAMEKRLGSIASDYLKPRLIQQKNFDAISLNALLCLALLGSPLCNKCVCRLKRLSLPWFAELLDRRLDWLVKAIKASDQSVMPAVIDAIQLLRTAK